MQGDTYLEPEHHHHHGHHHHKHPHGSHGHSSHQGKRGGRVRRGESKFLLMDALQDKPKHGYELIKVLEERSGGQYVPSPGVVYPTLQFLEEAGFVGATQEGDRRVFHLTELGQAEIAAHTEEIAAFWAQFVLPDTPSARAELGFLEEELEYLERAVRGGLRGNPDAELVRSVRVALENCRNEVRRLVATTTE
jgi:DNA-binding PadR family transcriptional regulator